MKKLLSVLSALLLTNVLFAAGANKMTMVTYFPVKYVAYSQVDVMKQMDVGLTSACQMNLGCTTDEGFNTGKSLRVNNLLKIAGGKLELNDAPAIVGSTAIMGSGNGTADFDFETNLRVANYKQGYTLQADNMYLSELNLFGYKFPACSGETMSWQKLILKNKDEVYLVCGEAEQGTNSCDMTSDDVLYRAQSCEMGGHNPNWKKGVWSTETCSCTCPAGTTMDEDGACIVASSCGDATYKASHKSECCPSAPTSDTICYGYYWTPTGWNGGNEVDCAGEGRGNYDGCGETCSEEGKTCEIVLCQDYIFEVRYFTCEYGKNGW
ncbi:hypothetical protein [Candidatus Avelusimicrobium sp.]|uniref:hypothetical protein n=1 Tax=Candidatus Avelusimicrobium sp. TaxID=3048833 RepID=UPI003D7E2A40